MNVVTLNELLPDARDKMIAVPQFNINGYQWIEAILNVVKETQDPVIIGVTDRNVERLGGYAYIVNLIKFMIKEKNINTPLVIHLDHGQDVENVKKAIEAGFSSVMFDGSHETLEINIKKTKEVVDFAQKYKVSVEGEIGGIGGIEDGIIGGIKYANPSECLKLVKDTQLDALAPALGSVHGVYVGEPDLQFQTMKEINDELNIPLVLHGASGLSIEDINKAMEYGHSKINFNTELNQAWANGLRSVLEEDANAYDPKILQNAGLQGIESEIKRKLDICNRRN